MKKNLAFIHLIKCGGTAFWQAIIQHYKIGAGDYRLTYSIGKRNTIDKFNKLSKKEKEEKHFFYGHMHDDYTIGKLIRHVLTQTDRKTNLVTVIRDPIERIISQYFYLRMDKNRENPMHNICNEISLEDIYRKDTLSKKVTVEQRSTINNFFFNYQTRVFSETKICLYKQDNQTNLINIDNIQLNVAKINLLDLFSYIGIQNTIDSDWEFFCERFKIKYPDPYFFKKENRPSVTDYTGRNIDQETIDLIRENNKYDIELYNWIIKEGRNIINSRELVEI